MTSPSSRRIDRTTYDAIAPDVVAALMSLGRATDASGLDKQLTELVKIRASQINGCAFCLQHHLNVARKLGVPASKIDLVATWAETSLYSARERAALVWAETLTRMSTQPVPEAVYAGLLGQFSTQEVAYLTAAVATINAWNRIAGGLCFAPPIPVAAPAQEART